MAVSTIRRSSPPRNQLLAALSARDFALLQPPLRSTELALKKDIERQNRRIDSRLLHRFWHSLVVAQSEGAQVEVGLIGYEGMSGAAVVLGGDQSPHSTYVQVAGDGQRIAAED